ncbi:P-type ATPase [Balamuthia mandrillaris]
MGGLISKCTGKQSKKKARNTRHDVPEELQAFYVKEAQEVADLLQVDPSKGLSEEGVLASREKWGLNELKQSGGIKIHVIIFHHFVNFMSFILFIAFVLGMATEKWMEASVVMFIIIVNALIGMFQEFKSEKTLEALKMMSSPNSRVLREGKKVEIPSSEIVPGDVVLLHEGDKVPADLRLFDLTNLECDEQLLTGESLPVEKTLEPQDELDTPVGNRTNVAFMSSTVTKGKGKGIAVYTGQRTELGMIADSVMGKATVESTHLEKKMMRLGIVLAAAALTAVGVVLLGLWLHDTMSIYPDGLQVAVSVAVALIPEALVPVITLTLTMGVRNMAKKNALVRKLNSLEQLGNITDICSDKTGTLTQGKMMATDVVLFPNRRFTVSGKGFDPNTGKVVYHPPRARRPSADVRRSFSSARESFDHTTGRRSAQHPRRSLSSSSDHHPHARLSTDRRVSRDLGPEERNPWRQSSERKRGRPSTDKRTSSDARPSRDYQNLRHSQQLPRTSMSGDAARRKSREEGIIIEEVDDKDQCLHMTILTAAMCNSSSIQRRPSEAKKKRNPMDDGQSTWWKPWTWCCSSSDESEDVEMQVKKRHNSADIEDQNGGGSSSSTALEERDDDQWVAVGSPTEAALLVLTLKLKYNKERLDEVWQPLAEYPFDSTVKLMSVAKRHAEDGSCMLFTKGAPERLVPCCTSLLADDEGTIVELDEEQLAHVKLLNEQMANEGLRVLALAYRELPEDWDPEGQDRHEDVEKDLVLVGLVGIKDPPRKGVRQAIDTCHRAGIRVRMLTGDHPNTSIAIARQIGIIPQLPPGAAAPLSASSVSGGGHHHPPIAKSEEGLAMTSTDFDRLTDEELDELEELPLVIARCSPQSKVKMVEQLHRTKRKFGNGAIVAMTGDGVNDSPAISAADVGISMGIAGTDVTKEASDIILMDDDFCTIVRAIEEGRRIFANIRKFIVHLLVGNVAQAILMVVSILSGFEPPLNPLQILWVNMVTGTPPALALGVEPASKDLMDVAKRPIGEPLFTIGTIVDILFYGIVMGGITLANFMVMEHAFQTSISPAQSTAYLTLTILLLLHGYNCRRLKRSAFGKGFFGKQALLFHLALFFGVLSVVFTLYVPGVNSFVFDHEEPGWEGWCLAFAASFVFMLLSELYKVVRWLCRKAFLSLTKNVGRQKAIELRHKKSLLRREREMRLKQQQEEAEEAEDLEAAEEEAAAAEMGEDATETEKDEEYSSETDSTTLTTTAAAAGDETLESSSPSSSDAEEEEQREDKDKAKDKADD